MITAEEVRSLFDYDPETGVLAWKKGSRGYRYCPNGIVRCVSKGRLVVRVSDVLYQAHRIIWLLVYGKLDENLEVEHKNRIGTDNRLENLRLATHQQNMCNVEPKSNASMWGKGVTLNKEKTKFRARIKVNYQEILLGEFNTASEAAAAYDLASKMYHGEFGVPNGGV